MKTPQLLYFHPALWLYDLQAKAMLLNSQLFCQPLSYHSELLFSKLPYVDGRQEMILTISISSSVLLLTLEEFILNARFSRKLTLVAPCSYLSRICGGRISWIMRFVVVLNHVRISYRFYRTFFSDGIWKQVYSMFLVERTNDCLRNTRVFTFPFFFFLTLLRASNFTLILSF